MTVVLQHQGAVPQGNATVVLSVVLQNQGAVPQGNATVVMQNQGAVPQGNVTVVMQNQGAVPQQNATVVLQNRKHIAMSLANHTKLAHHLNTRQKCDKFHLQVSCCDYRLAMFQVFRCVVPNLHITRHSMQNMTNFICDVKEKIL